MGSLLMVQILADLKLINSIFIQTWFAAFGNVVWAEYLLKLGIQTNSTWAALLGLCLALVIYVFFAICAKSSLKIFKELEFEKNFLTLFSWFSVGTFIFCFFAGMNYDYRLVFLIPVLFLTKNLPKNRTYVYIHSVLVLTFWLSFNAKYLQPLGDLLVNVVVVLLFFSSFHVFLRNYRKVF
jgi:hypothetical protein